MKALKVIFIILTVVIVLGLILAGAGLYFANRYLQSAEFKAQVVAAANKAAGTTVEIKDMKVSLFRGVELRGVAIGNPAGFTGNIVTAQAFTLQYSLWSAIRGRFTIETLALDSPTITLAKNAAGQWNYDSFSKRTEGVSEPKSTSAGTPLDITIEKIALNNAGIVMVKDTGAELLRIEGATVASAVDQTAGKLTGQGSAKITLINAGNAIFIRDVASPVALSTEAVKLTPLSGTLAGGTVAGDISLSLAGDSTYRVSLQVKDADVVTVMKEAGATRQVLTAGKLQLSTALAGTGGLETIVGTGTATITGGQLLDSPILGVVAALLQLPALQNLKFDECRLEFAISNNVMQTPVIALKSPQVQITGRGEVALDDYSLKHDLTLILAPSALEKSIPEVKALFAKREDGSFALEFKVWGPYEKPKTDLDKRLIKGAAGQLLEKFLKK